ncbi:MarR family winged helix-turn-helix transcriptional regulator [Noviherbaspirillum sedimenti]|uniref:MarR family transcriptional regulator n=1 Tax=Noviherbaspirillum sedimenti TaxID=2320865 RepID=A0A3A3FYD6_9BURK|nr:MarR family transcriptional regulator [Noviherbaspirillum sedimenti]RJG00631.1 MarR family transcriptional regulator [Noviherbaspirillum sedimenti]
MNQIAPQNASSRQGKSSAVVKNPKSRRTPEEINWDTRLGFLMHDVSRLRRTVFDEFMKPLGVTRSQWWVLAYLSRHDGMIQSDLADMLELGKAALGGLIDRLESSDFIQRRADATDRRVKRIYLTEKGVQIIKQMRNSNQDMSERILNGLNEAERQNLFELLALVKKNLVTIKSV